MSKHDLNNQDDLSFWRELKRRLLLVDREPPVSIEAVDQALVAGSHLCRRLAVAAVQVHDDPACDAGILDNASVTNDRRQENRNCQDDSFHFLPPSSLRSFLDRCG